LNSLTPLKTTNPYRPRNGRTDRANQIEHWRALPEAWTALHEVSRRRLLKAMGVTSLGAE